MAGADAEALASQVGLILYLNLDSPLRVSLQVLQEANARRAEDALRQDLASLLEMQRVNPKP